MKKPDSLKPLTNAFMAVACTAAGVATVSLLHHDDPMLVEISQALLAGTVLTLSRNYIGTIPTVASFAAGLLIGEVSLRSPLPAAAETSQYHFATFSPRADSLKVKS